MIEGKMRGNIKKPSENKGFSPPPPPPARVQAKDKKELTYPMYIRGKYFEMTEKQIEEYKNNEIIQLTFGEYVSILERLEKLENK